MSHSDDRSPFSSHDHLLTEFPEISSAETAAPAEAEGTNTNANGCMAWFTIRSGPLQGFAPGPRSRAKMSRKRRIALLRSYVPDWIITIVLAAVFFSLDKVPGFKREFSIEDPTLRFPYAVHERVPPVALYFIAIVAPFVIQIITNFLTVRSLWDFHNSTLGLLLGLTLTGAITQFTKITVGRPRPDVISRCQPPSGITDPEYELVTVAICTQTDVGILRDGWRSFPSGHSSLSFAGLGFLSFYLAGKLHLFDGKGHTTKAWISLTPLFAATLVAISRTMDYRHHWQDVLVGSLLGLLMSFFSYRQYYPPLGSSRSHRPFSPRIRRDGVDGDADGEEISPSEDSSNAPILPVTRPGFGSRTESHSLRGGVGRGGVGRGGGSERESGEGVTRPNDLHVMHSGHPSYSPGSDIGYAQVGGRYRDDGDVVDLQHGDAKRDGSVSSGHLGEGTEEVEMNGQIPMKR